MVNIIVGLKDDHKSLKELEKYGEIIHYLYPSAKDFR